MSCPVPVILTHLDRLGSQFLQSPPPPRFPPHFLHVTFSKLINYMFCGLLQELWGYNVDLDVYRDRVGDILTGESLELLDSMMRSIFHKFLDKFDAFMVGEAAFRSALKRVAIEILET